LEAVKLLVHRGGKEDISVIGQAASAAAEHGELELLRTLIDSGVQINEPVHPGSTTLLESYARSKSKRRSEIWTFLLGAGAKVNPPGQNRYRESNSLLTELIANAWDNDLVHLVLESGVGVNDRGIGEDGQTPIQAAALQDNLRLVKELHARGTDINAPTGHSYQRTALQAAYNSQVLNMDLVRYLLDHGADVNAAAGPVGGITALQGAAIRGHTDLVHRLLDDFGADMNSSPAIQEGRTALEGTAEYSHIDPVQILLNASAKPRKGDKDFHRAIRLTEEEGH
jgi:ankyrin repeat protein